MVSQLIFEIIISDLPKLFHSINLSTAWNTQAFKFSNHNTKPHNLLLPLEYLSRNNNYYKFFHTHTPVEGSRILSSSLSKWDNIQYLCVIDNFRVKIIHNNTRTIPALPTVIGLSQDVIFTDLNISRSTTYELNTSIEEYLRLVELDLYNYYYDYQRNLSDNLYDRGYLDMEVQDALLRVGGAISKSLYDGMGNDFWLCEEKEIVLNYLEDYTIKLK